MPELWKPIYGGHYEVSDQGRVRSVDRLSMDGRRWRGRILRQKPDKRDGRLMICASIDGDKTTPYVHTLVAGAFVGRRPRGSEINHKDGHYKNNRASNLEYVSVARNHEHAKQLGLLPTKKNGRWRRPS